MIPTETADADRSWYAATRAQEFELRVLANDLDVDVCIVGGSIAGLTLARELARQGWSAAVLEAGRIGDDGFMRGAGVVMPGFAETIERLVERAGPPRARELWGLSAAGADYVRSAIADAQMPGVDAKGGVLVVQDADGESDCRGRVDLLRDALGAKAEFWSTEQVRGLAASGLHHQAVYLPTAFHMHPLNYMLGLAADARRAGVRLYEMTPAHSVDAGGIRKQVQAGAYKVRARHIVLASLTAARLHPGLARTIVSLHCTVGVTGPLQQKLPQAIRFQGAVVRRAGAGLAHRIVQDDRLLWSEPLTVKPGRRRAAARMRRHIRQSYPQLGPVSVDYLWNTPSHYAVHRMPQIGELSPGLWLAGAFGWEGIASATMAGILLASAMCGGDDRWRLFEPYGLVWSGGWLGRTATRLALASMRLRAKTRALRAPRLGPLPALSTGIAPPVDNSRPAEALSDERPAASKQKKKRKRRAAAKPAQPSPAIRENAKEPVIASEAKQSSPSA
jgi:glycine/D-amino acid oxidase-like deaminating enzyme